jgi:ankyrin repeat protein
VSINALQDGTTALTWAVIHRQKNLIEALLDAGANLETGKMTPLYQALSSEDIDMAAFLVSQGAHINIKGPLTKRGMLYDLL